MGNVENIAEHQAVNTRAFHARKMEEAFAMTAKLSSSTLSRLALKLLTGQY